MSEDPVFRFELVQATNPEAQSAAVRRALDLIASFLGPGENELTIAEFERLLNEDHELALNALYGIAAIAAGLVRTEADRREEDPLEYLRGLERALDPSERERDDLT
jgi:hypothetical protein